MIPHVCRLNPTSNGGMHLGHCYLALVNEYEAHKNGGKFVVRFDDNQLVWQLRLGVNVMAENCKRIKKEIEWLGVNVDRWTYQSKIEDVAHSRMTKFMGKFPVREVVQSCNWPEVVGDSVPYYPYLAYITCEKVVMDFMDEVTLLIRGNDLLTEYALYEYFADLMGLPRIRQIFLPRLVYSDGSELAGMSKTEGNCSIQELQQKGWTAGEVMELLKKSCLKNQDLPFAIDNIVSEPKVLECDLKHKGTYHDFVGISVVA
jgi:glutamyl/glutaminyl-tRNA synthetase